MAKSWKQFIPQSEIEATQEQDKLSVHSKTGEQQNLNQALSALGIKNDELQSLLHERDKLEQTMKGLTQPNKDANTSGRRYDHLIPSFKEKKEAESKWLAFKERQVSKKLREKLLNKVKAKTAFSDAEDQSVKTDNEAPRFSKMKENLDRKKKNEERLRKPKELTNLKLESLKLPDSDELRAKLIAKKKEERPLKPKNLADSKLESLKLPDSDELRAKLIAKKKEEQPLKPKNLADSKLESLKLPDSDALRAKLIEKKKEERYLNAKSLTDLKLAERQLPDSDELKAKLIEKKKEVLDLFNKENRIKALNTLRVAKQKMENVEKNVKRLTDYTDKVKTETKKIEKKLSQVKDFYNKLDSASKQSGMEDLAKNLDKVKEVIGSDKLQALKKVSNEASRLKEKIINPVNESWEKLNEKRKQLLSAKQRFREKMEKQFSAATDSLPNLQEKQDQLQKLLEQKKEAEKLLKKKEEREAEKEQQRKEEKQAEKKREEDREKKREERRLNKKQNN